MKLWTFIKETMLRYPNQIICENNAKMTFEETMIWAEIFAKKLKGMKCCAILCHSEMATAMALLSCFAAGVTAVPLSVRYGELHCNKSLDLIHPDGVITDEGGEICVQQISNNTYVEPNARLALIMTTSGTTGIPKGVMLSEENIITNVKDMESYFAIGKEDTILISRPLYHCAVLSGEFLIALRKGTRIRFYSERFNVSCISKLLKDFSVTVFCGTPTMFKMMCELGGKKSWQTLRHICISGECMTRDTALKIEKSFSTCEIYHLYGLTEASPRVCYLPPKLFSAYPDYVGVLLPSVSARIIKEDGETASAGEEGLLWIKGKNIMMGYYQNPQKTKQVLKDGWLCTGDIAVMNSLGLLKIKGRKDDLINKAGMNIYPIEIESALKVDRRVKEVLAYGFETKFGVHIGIKIVGDFANINEVKQLCIQCLPAFQVPTSIEIVDKLPRTGSGKIARRN